MFSQLHEIWKWEKGRKKKVIRWIFRRNIFILLMLEAIFLRNEKQGNTLENIQNNFFPPTFDQHNKQIKKAVGDCRILKKISPYSPQQNNLFTLDLIANWFEK